MSHAEHAGACRFNLYPFHNWIYSTIASANYDSFQAAIDNWVDSASGQEKTRREKVAAGLDQIMSDHNFQNGGVVFSQFQRYLQSPYNPNLRDIYFVLNQAAQVAVSSDDVAVICNAANIARIAADALDLVLWGLVDKISNGGLSQLDIEWFQFEVDWLTGVNSKKIVLDDFLQQIEADPEEDCDSIFRNLDPSGVAALEEVMAGAVPGWTPPVLDYDSYDKNLNAWISFKFTDGASDAVAKQEIVNQTLDLCAAIIGTRSHFLNSSKP